jgi:hypothetical protein
MDRNEVKFLAATTAAIAFVALAADTGSAAAAGPATARPAVTTAGAPQYVGTFTGEYVNGAPVYRLPPVNVSTDRAEALARFDAEDQLAAARSTPATSAPLAAGVEPATDAPDRNIALEIGLAALGMIVALGLSFGVLGGAGRGRRLRG